MAVSYKKLWKILIDKDMKKKDLAMVICVPTGNPHKNPSGFWEDSTRLPKFYDGTYQYLKSLGIEEI